MLVNGELWLSTAATVVLWVLSGTLSVVLGFVLAAGLLSSHPSWRFLACAVVNVTRGVPTSLLVIFAGIGMMRFPVAPRAPTIFPGTADTFQHVAWGIALALALGSAGHLAMIFRSALLALGRYRREQAMVLGLSAYARIALLARESASIALPPTGTRLIHHLHNTAFAALFPVTDLFGYVLGQANATFRVLDFALLGAAIYVALSGLTWTLIRVLEAALAPPAAEPRPGMVIRWS